MKTQIKTRLEPPDGGWGILVCLGVAISHIGAISALPSFGLVFGDFLNKVGAGTSAISFITSAFYCSFSLAGLFSGSLFNRFGLRPVGLLGGFFYFLGSLWQIFVNSTLTLALAFSLIQGIGYGLIVPTSFATFNNYFVKKRVMWMSFTHAVTGVGTMFYPLLMRKLLEFYGFRGCLIVIAAINFHAVLGMLLMQPVEWHMRKVIITDDEVPEMGNGQELKKIVGKTLSLEYIARPEVEVMSVKSLGADSDQLSPLMRKRINSYKISREMLAKNSNRCSSVMSLGNRSAKGPIVLTNVSTECANGMASRRASAVTFIPENQTCDTDERSLCQTIVDFLDLTLLKEPIFVNIVLGVTFALYSDIYSFTLQPLYLFELGFNKLDTANIIAIAAAADLGSRIVLALLAMFIQIRSRYIYLAGAFFTVFARFVFLYAYDFQSMLIITAVMGFLRTWVHVPIPLIFAEYLPAERFASGFGLYMFLKGNIMFAISPIVGYIRDTTQDYKLTFHCLNFFMALSALLWIIEIILVKYRGRTKVNATTDAAI